jgi:hypothetical protein
MRHDSQGSMDCCVAHSHLRVVSSQSSWLFSTGQLRQHKQLMRFPVRAYSYTPVQNVTSFLHLHVFEKIDLNIRTCKQILIKYDKQT